MAHTILMFNSPEHQGDDISVVPTGGFAISTEQSSYGLRSWKLNAVGGAGYGLIHRIQSGLGTWIDGQYAYEWTHFHWFPSVLPGASQIARIAEFSDAALRAAVEVNDLGQIRIWGNTGGWSGYSPGHVEPGTWYAISFHYIQNGTIRCIVRDRDAGSEIANVTSTVNNDNHAYPRLGGSAVGSYGVYYFANLLCEGSNVAGNVEDPYLLVGGACGVIVCIPTANGTDNGWTGTYADVDEMPKDGTTTVRISSYAVNAHTNLLPDPSDLGPYPIDTVAALQSSTWCCKNVSGASTVAHRVRRGAGFWDTGVIALPAQYVFAHQGVCFMTDPTDGQPWTTTRVKEVEIGNKTDNGSSVRWCTQAFACIFVTFQITPEPPRRILHYILDVNDPRQLIRDQFDREVPPEELRPNKWLAIVGWRGPTPQPAADYINDPEKLPINSVRFTEPDDYSLGSGSDDLLDSVIARITQRGA